MVWQHEKDQRAREATDPRFPAVSDAPKGVLSPESAPEQLKSGKQNKQQLLLGCALLRGGSPEQNETHTLTHNEHILETSKQFLSIFVHRPRRAMAGGDGPHLRTSQVFTQVTTSKQANLAWIATRSRLCKER